MMISLPALKVTVFLVVYVVIWSLLHTYIHTYIHTLFIPEANYRVFSRDVTAAMLVSLNKRTAAMLVSPINPRGIELYFLCKRFLLLWLRNTLIDHVSENTLYIQLKTKKKSTSRKGS